MPTFQFPPYFTHDMTNLDLQKKLDTRGPRKCKHFVKLQVARGSEHGGVFTAHQ